MRRVNKMVGSDRAMMGINTEAGTGVSWPGRAKEVPGAVGGGPAQRVRGAGGAGIGERDHRAASQA